MLEWQQVIEIIIYDVIFFSYSDTLNVEPCWTRALELDIPALGTSKIKVVINLFLLLVCVYKLLYNKLLSIRNSVILNAMLFECRYVLFVCFQRNNVLKPGIHETSVAVDTVYYARYHFKSMKGFTEGFTSLNFAGNLQIIFLLYQWKLKLLFLIWYSVAKWFMEPLGVALCMCAYS